MEFFSLIPSNYRFLHSYSYNKMGRLKNLNIHDESFISLNEFAIWTSLIFIWFDFGINKLFLTQVYFSAGPKARRLLDLFLKAASRLKRIRSFHPGLTGCYSFSIQPLTCNQAKH